MLRNSIVSGLAIATHNWPGWLSKRRPGYIIVDMEEFEGVPTDTEPAASKQLSALIRAMSDQEKLRRLGDACEFVRSTVIAGIKERHPNSSEDDIRRRFAAITLGANLAERYYGWNKELHGY